MTVAAANVVASGPVVDDAALADVETLFVCVAVLVPEPVVTSVAVDASVEVVVVSTWLLVVDEGAVVASLVLVAAAVVVEGTVDVAEVVALEVVAWAAVDVI